MGDLRGVIIYFPRLDRGYYTVASFLPSPSRVGSHAHTSPEKSVLTGATDQAECDQDRSSESQI